MQAMFAKEKAKKIEQIRAMEAKGKMFADEVPDGAVDNSESYDGDAAAQSFSRTKKTLFNNSTVAAIRSAGHFDETRNRNKVANSPHHDPKDYGAFSFDDYKRELESARKTDNAKDGEEVYHEFTHHWGSQHNKIINNLRGQQQQVDKDRAEAMRSFSLTR